MGRLAPQGYLLIEDGDLIVPCSTVFPARFDLTSGALSRAADRGSFASTPAEKEALKLKRRGLLFDEVVNVKSYEDKPRAEELAGIRRTLHAAEQEWSFDRAWPELEGKAHSVVVADDKCFAVTEDVVLQAYASAAAQNIESVQRRMMILTSSTQTDLARKLIHAAGIDRGYALRTSWA